MQSHLKSNVQYRRDVLKVLLWVTFVCGVFFFAINMHRGLILIACLEVTYAILSLFMLRFVDTTTRLNPLIFAYLTPFFSIMLFALSIPDTSQSIFAWILMIPILSYLLLGRKLGFWFSLFFVLMGAGIYNSRFTNEDFALILTNVLNVTLTSFAMMSFAHVFEVNREKNELRLLELACTDLLTGLANRVMLVESFEQIKQVAGQGKLQLGVVVIDLDFFKHINDEFGHDVGDKALCHVADHLTRHKGPQDLVSRFGGEEFALVVVGKDYPAIEQRIEMMREKLQQQPVELDEHVLAMTFSAGIAYDSDGKADLNALLIEADRCLYEAKKSGRNRVCSHPPFVQQSLFEDRL